MCYNLPFSFISPFSFPFFFCSMLLFTMSTYPPITHSLHKAHCIHIAVFCSLSQCHAISSRSFPRVFINFKIQTSLDPTEVLKGVKRHCQVIRVTTTQLLLDRDVCSSRVRLREQPQEVFTVQENTHISVWNSTSNQT